MGMEGKCPSIFFSLPKSYHGFHIRIHFYIFITDPNGLFTWFYYLVNIRYAWFCLSRPNWTYPTLALHFTYFIFNANWLNALLSFCIAPRFVIVAYFVFYLPLLFWCPVFFFLYFFFFGRKQISNLHVLNIQNNMRFNVVHYFHIARRMTMFVYIYYQFIHLVKPLLLSCFLPLAFGRRSTKTNYVIFIIQTYKHKPYQIELIFSYIIIMYNKKEPFISII